MRPFPTRLVAAVLAITASPAVAEVAALSERGFVSHNVVDVPAGPAAAWAALSRPSEWWNGEHSYSGSAANLTIEAVAGGCFCETIPAAGTTGAGQVEHMRVVYVNPRAGTLRLAGALGPLQSEAVTGALTMSVEPSGSGSKITWDYVVGGYTRGSMAELAPLVDRVIAEQLSRLAASLSR